MPGKASSWILRLRKLAAWSDLLRTWRRGIKQTSPQSYRNTGFDKGHLAPSLAMSFQKDKLKKIDRSPWISSYYASNIAPQPPGSCFL